MERLVDTPTSCGDGAERGFPSSPIQGTLALRPLDSWAKIYAEIREMGAEFDGFWYETVMAEACYFYRWQGSARATVLVVFSKRRVLWIESRAADGQVLGARERSLIEEKVLAEFVAQGFGIDRLKLLS